MTDTVGLPLEASVRLLESAGFTVRTDFIQSRKGTDGEDARVVRQTIDADGTVHLSASKFVTSVKA